MAVAYLFLHFDCYNLRYFGRLLRPAIYTFSPFRPQFRIVHILPAWILLPPELLNEAVEIAANRYNIQIGKQTVQSIDAARDAALKAARDFANGKLAIAGDEAEKAGINPPV